MGIRVFIDDERSPKTEDFSFICRSYDDWDKLLYWCIKQRIKISYVLFGFSLSGESQTMGDCAKLLVEKDGEFHILTEQFNWNCYPDNNIGRDNIDSYLANWLEFKKSFC